MPTSLISTGVQFPDNSVQTTAATGGGGYALNAYVSPATWNKPAGLKAVKVTVVGAGGAGGNVTTGPIANDAAASGGGGGGAAIQYIPAPSIPGPVSVTAGPGTNSFGAFCSATAGGNGSFNPATGASGGAGGAGSGGQVNITGNGGGAVPRGGNASGFGGGSIFAGGARGVTGTVPAAGVSGIPGSNYGGGASGGARYAANTNNPGGTGAPGIVIVEEFY